MHHSKNTFTTQAFSQDKAQSALIFSKKPSTWNSAKIIAKNLRTAYVRTGLCKQRTFNLSSKTDHDELLLISLADEIFKKKPGRLIFVDDVVPPSNLIFALEEVYGTHPLPAFYFHIYGNFSLRINDWIRTEAIFKKTPVHFICASLRQSRFVGNFITRSSAQLSVCPFPVNSDQFFFSAQLRIQTRQSLGMKENEKALLYTGRLSLQKNILLLTQQFALLVKTSKLPLHLFLAGHFDDIPIPSFSSRTRKLGSYCQQWMKLVGSLDQEIQSRIHYLGPLSTQELNSLYNASDLFVSLSLYHDEDFGMSPAEALCTGLPVVLTNWGGFSSFDSSTPSFPEKICSLIDVRLAKNGFFIDTLGLQKALLEKIHSLDQFRPQRSDLAKSWLSIDAVVEQLLKIHSKKTFPLHSFSELMRKLAKAYTRPAPFLSGPKKGSLYEDVYQTYLQDTHSTPNR